MKSPYREITPRTITPEQSHLPPDKCCPWNSSRNKCPRTFVLYNKPWITYRWISKKALFKHSKSHISNKFWKRLSEGLCMLLRGKVLYRWNPSCKGIEPGFILTIKRQGKEVRMCVFVCECVCVCVGRGGWGGGEVGFFHSCGSSKNVSSREMVKPWFFETFDVVINLS